ncbi:MAG: ABC transporter ATP-binding protein [Syntrophus sp. (in: bacteria)]
MRLKVFLEYSLHRFPRLLIIYAILLIVTGVCDALAVFALAPIVDILLHPDLQGSSSVTKWIVKIMMDWGLPVTLVSVLTVFLGFNVLKGGLQVLSVNGQSRIRMAVSRCLIVDSFKDFMGARWAFFSSQKQGMLINTFTRETDATSGAFSYLAQMFAGIVQLTFFLVVPMYISWQVTLASIVASLLLAAPFLLLGRLTYRLGQQTTDTANQLTIVLQESLSMARVILGYANQHKNVQSLREAYERHAKAAIKSLTLQYAQPVVYQPLGVVVLMITLYVSQRIGLSFSELAVILYAFLRVLPIVGILASQKNLLESSFPSYEQIENLTGQARKLRQISGERTFTGFKHTITIEALSFSYPDRPSCLQEINMVIPKGKMVAIVGRSGSGKSTLIDTIIGFNEPSDGQVYVDGIPLREFEINSYRKRLGYVPQESLLFNMTVRENLLWAREDATKEELREACVVANAAEFIEQFPEGYDTFVGDRGVRLSGGQIQRVALARAVLRNPDILILDEATSSLDSESERLIQLSIETIAKKMTVIVIAHRLSTIAKADYIYVLEDGRIVEEGEYSQLLINDGSFSQMHLLGAEAKD